MAMACEISLLAEALALAFALPLGAATATIAPAPADANVRWPSVTFWRNSAIYAL